MAAVATERPPAIGNKLGCNVLLDIIHGCLHARRSEWVFMRELRVGTGFQGGAAQRLDAFALNCLPHTSMKRVCYEVKTSRADFLCEMKKPLKRRMGLRYSNEFYFVAPAGLLDISEIPVECGLVEIGTFEGQSGALAHFDPVRSTYCRITIPAPWRETPGRRRYAAESTKGFPSASPEAAEPTAPSFFRLTKTAVCKRTWRSPIRLRANVSSNPELCRWK